MSTAKTVVFWVGTGLVGVAFVCGLVTKFTSGKTKDVFNWITIGCTLGAAACYVAYDVMK